MLSSQEKLAGYLSDEEIEEFRAIYQRQNGRKISKPEAYDRALHLIGFMRWLYRPMGQAEFVALRSMPEPQDGQAETKAPNPYSKVRSNPKLLQGGASHD